MHTQMHADVLKHFQRVEQKIKLERAQQIQKLELDDLKNKAEAAEDLCVVDDDHLNTEHCRICLQHLGSPVYNHRREQWIFEGTQLSTDAFATPVHVDCFLAAQQH